MPSDIFIDPSAGSSIESVSIEACAIAQLLHRPIHFTFNQIKMKVHDGSHPDDIMEIYHLKFRA